MIGTDNPDLTAFRDRGGKAILWHGWADPLITAEGTIDYYKRVQQQMGSAERPLCQYPLVARYKGTGSTDDAANFVCSTGF